MTGSSGGNTGTGGSIGTPGSGGTVGAPDAGVMAGRDGSAGTGGGSGADGGQSLGGRVCNGLPAGVQPPYMPVYRIPLRVHRTRSDLNDDQLCRILEEVNEIWWTQAAVCYEMTVVRTDPPAATGLDFFFERSTPFPNGVSANGVYSGAHQIYGLDRPSLGAAPTPGREPAARTCAHELGHALTLGHQNPGESCLFQGNECDDLLMRSGRRGYKVTGGSPANVNEQTRARTRAQALSLPQTDTITCAAPRIMP